MKICSFFILALCFVCMSGYAINADDDESETTDDIENNTFDSEQPSTSSANNQASNTKKTSAIGETTTTQQETAVKKSKTEDPSDDSIEPLDSDTNYDAASSQESESGGSEDSENEDDQKIKKVTEEPKEEAEGNEREEKKLTEDDAETPNEDVSNNEETNKKSPEACNIKFKKVGCFKSKKKSSGFQHFLKTDTEAEKFTKKGKVADNEVFNKRLPNMACECAKAALEAGNAIFSLKNIAECWTGSDDTIYDSEGPSNKCVTFSNQQCEANSELCSGKKHSTFVYYIDTPEHTKSPEEIKKELDVQNKKITQVARKAAKEAEKSARKHKKKNKNKKHPKSKGKKKEE